MGESEKSRKIQINFENKYGKFLFLDVESKLKNIGFVISEIENDSCIMKSDDIYLFFRNGYKRYSSIEQKKYLVNVLKEEIIYMNYHKIIENYIK